MKTALCLSGQSRTFSKCFESQYNNIIKPLHADVFIHTWAYAGNPHVHSTHNGSYDVTKYKNSVDSYEYSTPLTDINKIYKPKIMLVEYPDYNFFIISDSFCSAVGCQPDHARRILERISAMGWEVRWPTAHPQRWHLSGNVSYSSSAYI